jgi:hypothetical protein
MSSTDQPDNPSLTLTAKRQHNASTKLASLPTELLVQVLWLLVITPVGPGSEAYSFLDVEDTIQISSTWFNVTLVCFRIRQVALSIPELWSYINCNADIRWINLCCERSGECSLTLSDFNDDEETIGTDSEYEAPTPLEEAMIEMIPRARMISIRLTLPMSPAMQDVLQRSLPRLISVDLHIIDFPMITPLAGPQNATLTRLSLLQVCLDTSMVFPSLTYLGLHVVSIPFGNEFMDLLNFISHSPLLEVLVVDEMNMDDPDLDDARMNTTISCPHLRIFAATEESFSITWCILRALPDPHDGLHLDMTKYPDFPEHQAELRKMQLPAEPNSADEAMHHRVTDFWKKKTGKPFLGPGRMHFDVRHPSLNFGRRFDRDTPSPSLFLRMQVKITGQDPWLSDIKQAVYESSEDPLWPIFEGFDVLPNLVHIHIKGGVTDVELDEKLDRWMQSHQRHGGHPVNIHFWPGKISGIEARSSEQAERLRQKPYVNQVTIRDVSAELKGRDLVVIELDEQNIALRQS